MSDPVPEPWLRGGNRGFDPVVAHLLRASEQIQEEIERAIGPLNEVQLWSRPHGMTPAGFHAKHLAGSIDRLSTYLEGRQLSHEQLADLRAENAGAESAADLIARVQSASARYERIVKALRPENFADPREVGRRRLKTTAVGLAIHIAEHGQRHVGQAINAAKLALVIHA